MSRAITGTDLTVREERFCRALPKHDFNGTQAAIAAKYSKKTAAAQASRLLKNVKIQKRIAQLAKKYFDNEDLEVQTIVRHLINMAAFDLSEMYTEYGHLKNIHDMPEHIRRIIQGVKTTRTEDGDGVFTTVEEIKTPDRLKATELLGRYLKMFVDQVEHKGNVTLEIRLASQDDGGNGKLLDDGKK